MTGLASGMAVFLDRDGTLIREVGYLSRPDQVEILPGVPAALRRLREFGFRLVVVTNQSAVARGHMSEPDLVVIHELLREKLMAQGAVLDALYYCPHHPTEGLGSYRIFCNCRKPQTGLVEKAVLDLQLDPSLSYVVGDQWTDMQLAKQVGATGILLGNPPATIAVDYDTGVPVVTSLLQAAQWIIDNEGRRSGSTELR
jgi:D-glycero-D-manno-heptose 1,7-bisphosphate phosphatase